jgi:NADH-quinone oxidoreductase subunit C
MSASEIIALLQSAVPDASYVALTVADGDRTPTIGVHLAHLVPTCRALHEGPDLQFVAFSDVTAADFFPLRHPRFDLVYHLVAPERRRRVRLKVQVGEGEAVPSVTGIWPGAGWPEREVYDLFGIVFEGHSDLRRLLMPDDWNGHPLRKDYPVQVRKDAETYMPLQVTAEEFRASLERDRVARVGKKPGA